MHDGIVREGGPVDMMLAHALAYLTQGWPLIPCHWNTPAGCSCGNPECKSAGKHPLVREGSREASRQQEQIEAWWQQWPQANIGGATGSVSQRIVIDVDTPLGYQHLARLALPQTLTQITGSGGRHLIYKSAQPIRNSAGRIGNKITPNIDVRGEGGYILLAPSTHHSGGLYRWQMPLRKIMPLPTWIGSKPAAMPLVRPLGRPTNMGRYVDEQIRRVAQAREGERNDQLNRAAFLLAHHVRDGLLMQDKIWWALVDAAQSAGLGLREAQATVAGAFRAAGAVS